MARRWRLERLVHGLFIAGLAVSAALLLSGVIRVMLAGEGRPMQAPALREIVPHALGGDPLAWLYAGLVALMLMPIVRVLLLAAGFAQHREWKFAATALIVLVALLISLRLGMH